MILTAVLTALFYLSIQAAVVPQGQDGVRNLSRLIDDFKGMTVVRQDALKLAREKPETKQHEHVVKYLDLMTELDSYLVQIHPLVLNISETLVSTVVRNKSEANAARKSVMGEIKRLSRKSKTVATKARTEAEEIPTKRNVAAQLLRVATAFADSGVLLGNISVTIPVVDPHPGKALSDYYPDITMFLMDMVYACMEQVDNVCNSGNDPISEVEQKYLGLKTGLDSSVVALVELYLPSGDDSDEGPTTLSPVTIKP